MESIKERETIKVSIVVPVYNVEEWLGACLDSLIPLNHKSIEVIIVNDGSTDRSREIAFSYQNKFEHFVIHDQINQGASAARNSGLRLASGRYVCFFDSDDFIDSAEFEEFINDTVRLDVDVSSGNGYFFKDNKISGSLSPSNHVKSLGVIDGSTFYLTGNHEKEFRVFICLNLYRKSFLVKENLILYNGIIHEDEEFAPKVFALAEKVVYLDRHFYFYRHRIGSVTKSIKHKYLNPKSISSFIAIIKSLGLFLKEKKLSIIQREVVIHAVHKCVLEILRRQLFYTRNSLKELLLAEESKKNLQSSYREIRFSSSQRFSLIRIKSKILLFKFLHR